MDAVDEAECDREDPDYINKPGNPRIGTGDVTNIITSTRNAGDTEHVHADLDLSGFEEGLFCIMVEATLVKAEGKGKSVTGYLAATDFGGNSPHDFVEGDYNTP